MAGLKIEADLSHEVVKYELDFLQDIDGRGQLFYDPEFIKNAWRRYEKCWLPFVQGHSDGDVAPPLDVHWVWHVHMLAPCKYVQDLAAAGSRVLNHRPKPWKTWRQLREQTQLLWNDENEPFWPPNKDDYESGAEPHDSQFSYDILSAALRQKVFFYQVSLNENERFFYIKTDAKKNEISATLKIRNQFTEFKLFLKAET